MSKSTLVVEGYLSKDPELGHTNGGDAYLGLSIPHTPRRKNRETGEWEDAGDTLWVQSTLWREDAELFAPLLRKGTQVRVEGEPVLRSWESGEKSGTNLEIKFPRVSVIPRRPKQDLQAPPAEPAADEWAQGTFNDETPF